MRGGFLHNEVLIGPLRVEAQRHGLGVEVEAPVTMSDETTGYLDLLLTIGSYRVAVEAERSPRRVGRDLAKAAAIKAIELWIVVPHVDAARAVRRALDRIGPSRLESQVFILTQGQSLQRLGQICALFSGSDASPENKSATQQVGQRQ